MERGRLAVALAKAGVQYIAMSASVDGQLRFAIAGKRLIEVSYKGSDRLVEPHDYGVQRGKEHLFVFQRRVISGYPGRSRSAGGCSKSR